MNPSFFTDTDFPTAPRSFFVLDIDGTLVVDGEKTAGSAVREAVRRLKKHHTVCIASNGKNRARNESLAHALRVPYVAGTKPFGKITAAIHLMNTAHLPIVVVGDRSLTDGLLAIRIAGVFVPVKPLRTGSELWHTKAAYALDAMIARVIHTIGY